MFKSIPFPFNRLDTTRNCTCVNYENKVPGTIYGCIISSSIRPIEKEKYTWKQKYFKYLNKLYLTK